MIDRPSDREVVFSRLLDAPPELVWQVWTEPRHIHQWWGPVGFTTTTQEFAFVPGRIWRHIMHSPDGTPNPSIVIFREIQSPSRLVYENGWDLPGAPLDFKVVVTFAPDAGKTRLWLHITFQDAEALKTAVERYGVLEGGPQTLGRLAQYLRRLDRRRES